MVRSLTSGFNKGVFPSDLAVNPAQSGIRQIPLSWHFPRSKLPDCQVARGLDELQCLAAEIRPERGGLWASCCYMLSMSFSASEAWRCLASLIFADDTGP